MKLGNAYNTSLGQRPPHGSNGIKKGGKEHDRLHVFNSQLISRVRNLKSELNEARDSNDPDRVAVLKAELANTNEMQRKTSLALHSLESGLSSKYNPEDSKAIQGVSVYLDKGEFMEISDAAGAFLYDAIPVDELEDFVDVIGSSKTSSSSSTTQVDGTNADGDEYSLDGAYLLELQRNDPEAFRAALDKVPDGLKQSAYMNIQNEIQSENRFWSMMTSIQQADHDTAKKIIGNFRV